MRIVGTLVRPLAEQADRDGYRIDPKGVDLSKAPLPIPVFRNFDYGALLGSATVGLDGNQLVATAVLNEDGAKAVQSGEDKLAIGLYVSKYHTRRDHTVIRKSRLMGVSLTGEHSDPGQPSVTVAD